MTYELYGVKAHDFVKCMELRPLHLSNVHKEAL
jgi:hypothetical protein